jgi:hypothetical protein
MENLGLELNIVQFSTVKVIERVWYDICRKPSGTITSIKVGSTRDNS